MQQFLFVLFQLDEARRYLEDGRIERLRLALLILDNAAEIQLTRRCGECLQNESFRERMRSATLHLASRKHSDNFKTLVDWHPLTPGERNKIGRFFDEKVKYLDKRVGDLDARLVGPLKYLHRYRNEAYHGARVRSETISTAAAILLEVNCQLLLTLPRQSACFAFNEDYTWMKERFGIDGMQMTLMEPRHLKPILDDIRSRVVPNDESVAAMLVGHLQSRFEDLRCSIEFVVENSPSIHDAQEVLDACRSTAESEHQHIDLTLEAINRIECQIPRVQDSRDRLQAFYEFSVVERALEPIERCVDRLADEVDFAIQMEIDRRRGK